MKDIINLNLRKKIAESLKLIILNKLILHVIICYYMTFGLLNFNDTQIVYIFEIIN
jgi:hypothetical protein